MKVKIRGLVFAGFAAAVFAQSASAEITDSDKTVTSKTYVDSYAQAQADRVLTKPDADSPLWDNTDKYPSMKVLGDKVEEVSTALSNLRADEEYITLETVGSGTTAHQEITVKSSNLATTAGSITDTTAASNGAPAAQDKLVTASAVNAYAEAKANKLATDSNGETITANNTSDTTYPTTKNVYDFVTGGDGTGYQRKLTAAEKDPSLGVYNADGTSVWRAARGGTYVTMDTSGTGAITFDVPSNKIATIGADNPNTQDVNESEITADSTKLTTGKAVYEFVVGDPSDPNSGFQPKATATANGVSTGANPTAQVGVRTGTGSEQDPYVSTWYGLAAGQDGSTLNSSIDDTAYARVYRDDGAGSNTAGVYVDLDHTRISVASTYTGTGYKHGGIVNISNYFSEDGMALATAGAVKEYVESVLPETTLPPESEMPSVCKTANGNHVCALVAYYDANASGTGVGGVKYEWTVMAPTGN